MTEKKETPAALWRGQGEPDPHGTQYECQRSELTMGALTDDELANGAFMNYDQPLNVAGIMAGTHSSPIAWMTAVKDRIRWLSRQLVYSQTRNNEQAVEYNNLSDAYVKVLGIKEGSLDGVPSELQHDMITVPRGLIGAACAAISRKWDAPNLLDHLRCYTMGKPMMSEKPCTGRNCGTLVFDHSPECVADYTASIAGGWFLKTPNVSAEVLSLLGSKIIEIEHGDGYSPEQRDYVLPVLRELLDRACAIAPVEEEDHHE